MKHFSKLIPLISCCLLSISLQAMVPRFKNEALMIIKQIETPIKRGNLTADEITFIQEKFGRLNQIKELSGIPGRINKLHRQFLALQAKKPVPPVEVKKVELQKVVVPLISDEPEREVLPIPVREVPARDVQIMQTKKVIKNLLGDLNVTYKNYFDWEERFTNAIANLLSLQVDQKEIEAYKGQKNIKLLGLVNALAKQLENTLTQDDRVEINSFFEGVEQTDISPQVRKRIRSIILEI